MHCIIMLNSDAWFSLMQRSLLHIIIDIMYIRRRLSADSHFTTNNIII